MTTIETKLTSSKTFLSWKTDELFFTLLLPEPAEGRTASNTFFLYNVKIIKISQYLVWSLG